MPWVFTYNDWSAGTEYDQMVKAAVTSAIVAARMKPHCMFSGSEESEMYQWLVGMNVTIIQVGALLAGWLAGWLLHLRWQAGLSCCDGSTPPEARSATSMKPPGLMLAGMGIHSGSQLRPYAFP